MFTEKTKAKFGKLGPFKYSEECETIGNNGTQNALLGKESYFSIDYVD